VAGTLVAVYAAYLTAKQLKEAATQAKKAADQQDELQAVNMFSEYSKQAYEVGENGDAFAIFVQHTAETILRLRPNDPGWKATARALLIDNREALLAVTDWHGDTWAPEFYDLAKEVLPGLSFDSVPSGRER
jgi:hypothetical protein